MTATDNGACAPTPEQPNAAEVDRIFCLEHPSLCAVADFASAFYDVLPADPTRDQRARAWRRVDPVYIGELTWQPDAYDREERLMPSRVEVGR